jgi:adenine-specific DNA-methyltransferase
MERFYTVSEVSHILGLTRQTISTYIKDKKLHAIKLGKSYRIYKKDLTDFINQCSMVSENIIEYNATSYEGFGFLNDIEKNGYPDKIYKLEPYEITHDEEFNTFILGDNYFVLKQLLPKIRGRVDLIYIDPPFGTGQIFSDLDNNHAYEDTLVNDKFLSFLRDRLYLLKMCLSKQGSIYLHIDKKIGHYVKIIMDEVFGYKNFINDITRIKCNPKNFKRKAYGNYSDMILYYAKNKDEQIWNDLKEPLEQDDIDRLFPKEDDHGNRYTTHPIHAPGETEDGDTGKEWKGMMPPKGRHWRYSRKKLTELDNHGLIEWSVNGNPRKIVYAKNHKGKKVQDVWAFKDKGKSYVAYPTQKNQDLLERIIKNSSNEGSLVLDCFAGSGSTLIAADKYNRSWIGIDNSDYSLETMIEKFKERKIQYNFVKLFENELQVS